jgi:hypothetical protein
MQTTLLLAATAAKAGNWETFLSGFPHLIGMLVVMITLTGLWGVCALTAWLVKRLAPEPVAATVAPAPPVDVERQQSRAAAPASTSGIAPEIVAVIAAAVHTAVGKGHKVISIKPHDTNWQQAGRHSVLGSHRIR